MSNAWNRARSNAQAEPPAAALQADRRRQGRPQPDDPGVRAAPRPRRPIPRKRNERRRGPFNRAIYRERNRVERLINRLKQWRRLATRYEKRAASHQALWVIAATLLWL